MAIGTITIGQTPCCGVIERTYETWPDSGSETGIWHVPGEHAQFGNNWVGTITKGGPYAPTFGNVAAILDRGTCPNCGKRF